MVSITQLHFITKSSYRAGRRCTRVDLRCEGQVSESLPVVGEFKTGSGWVSSQGSYHSVGRLTSGTSWVADVEMGAFAFSPWVWLAIRCSFCLTMMLWSCRGICWFENWSGCVHISLEEGLHERMRALRLAVGSASFTKTQGLSEGRVGETRFRSLEPPSPIENSEHFRPLWWFCDALVIDLQLAPWILGQDQYVRRLTVHLVDAVGHIGG